jgi:glycosyltransferase involved in cell wall biosynthesis
LDLVDDGKNGYLIDLQDVPAFSNALRGMISNPEALLRFREASIEKSHKFDIQKIVDQYQSILREVVNGH